MTTLNLRDEKLEVLPQRYETAFISVRDVNVALVSQSNANVQAVGHSVFVANFSYQNNSSYIWQR